MKLLVLVLSVVVAAFARPDVSEIGGGLSGSYLPGVGSGSSILGGGIGGGYNGIGGGIGGIGGIGGGGVGVGGNHQDQKHVYFYAAPDDEGPARLKINIAPSSHKNTKIIFIKAPSAGGVIPEVIAPPSQHEDKTLVYVLVKKQQQGGAITIPSSLGVKSAKPEVFFIKYRSQQEAEQAVSQGLGGQSVGSGLQDLGNEQAFVRSFKDSGIGGGIIGGGGGIIGGGGDISGSSILGGSIGGGSLGDGGISISANAGGARYGAPGASGPY
ncbi:hypothetical protein ILUMI_09678 [Ignelater luminosus]|uniref:DUF243 domain-containing protein n=1 Tax=Ignelater luminosus TaxID=2038154 RepID=A0A8K0CZA6_IGNLU|nr:hypothetical protein ILUMI_09678 [Ignelater luminosus]